jgi:hypothetical protein
MLRPIDIYTTTQEFPIVGKSGSLGTIYMRYEVRRVTDLRNMSETVAYRMTCTTRILIADPQAPPTWPAFQYTGYPARIDCGLNLGVKTPQIRIVDYSPRTINASVSTAASSNVGGTNSNSIQHSSGSATTQTNTYGASVSVGLMGPSATADYSHSTSDESSQSQAASTDTGSSRDSGESDSISIKDWAGYASLAAGVSAPAWTWAQEYPWDFIQFNTPLPGSTDGLIPIPQAMMDRMIFPPPIADIPFLVAPPSYLSLFGVDLTMKACWEFDLPPLISDQHATMTHKLGYWSASHGLETVSGSEASFFSIDKSTPEATYTSSTLDLTLLGLDPILSGDGDNGAVVGFIKSKFLAPPAAGATFKILSDENNLQVEGAGFNDQMTTAGAAPASVTVSFKVLDTSVDYALFIKGWLASAGSCLLSFTFNNDPDTTVTRRIDTLEGQGGENNLASIVMRNKDYTSNDYHDYLRLGTNTIQISILPDGSGSAAPFTLKAMAIGEA